MTTNLPSEAASLRGCSIADHDWGNTVYTHIQTHTHTYIYIYIYISYIYIIYIFYTFIYVYISSIFICIFSFFYKFLSCDLKWKLKLLWIILIHAQVKLICNIIFQICCRHQKSVSNDQNDEISNPLEGLFVN